MIRKLLMLAVLAVTAFALSAASASAFEVEVENPGEHQVTGENTLAIHANLGESPQMLEIDALRCYNDWHLSSSSDGHVEIAPTFEFHDPGSAGNCNGVEPCDNHTPWEGQIEEHSPHWEYAVHVGFCLEGTGSAETDGETFLVECEISADGDEGHCGQPGGGEGHHSPEEEESHLFIHEVAPGVFAEFGVEGEVFIDPPLELEHVEKG